MVTKELLWGIFAYAVGVFAALHVVGRWHAAGPNANDWAYGVLTGGVLLGPVVLAQVCCVLWDRMQRSR